MKSSRMEKPLGGGDAGDKRMHMKLTKLLKLSISGLLALSLSAVFLTSCGNNDSGEETTEEESGEFSYSDGIADNGHWEGITAKDYVPEVPNYDSFEIPSDVHKITDEAVQAEIDTLLDEHSTTEEVTDRAIEDGDTVNIDYVGSVDGVEFEMGSTGGAGTDVTIGVTTYIDDFLEQLIGHTPGETFNVEVTFPDPYENNPDLAGKDAVFVTTINHIAVPVEAELTDEFVANNLSESKGWKTIDEMKEGLRTQLQETAIQEHLYSQFSNEVEVSEIPEKLFKHEQDAMLNYYEEYASYYSMELDEFLSSNMGVESAEALLESNRESNEASVRYSLVMQAIAEDSGMSASEEDISAYFLEMSGTDDYSSYEEQYGKPYLTQTVLFQKIVDHLTENANLA